MKLEGQLAIVTGGGGAIGSAVAKLLAAEGAEIAVFDLRPEAAEATVGEIEASGGRAFAFCGDLGDAKRTAEMVEETFARRGRIDILVNCAGGSARERNRPFHEQSLDVVKEVLDVNLYGLLYCTHAAVKHMVKAKSGRIVNISSIVGMQGKEALVDYSAAKGAVIAATKSLAKELGQYNILANCVAPGLVQRPGAIPDAPEDFAKRFSFLNRICTQEDVAQVVLFLCLPESGYVTGQNYVVDGGRSLALMGDWR